MRFKKLLSVSLIRALLKSAYYSNNKKSIFLRNELMKRFKKHNAFEKLAQSLKNRNVSEIFF